MTEEQRPQPNAEVANATAKLQRPRQRRASKSLTAIHVEVVGGPMDGVTARVESDVLTIGRSPRSDLALGLDPLVSMKHAQILRKETGFWLEDLGSSNGTYVGEHQVQDPILIGPGTVVSVGSTTIEFTPG